MSTISLRAHFDGNQIVLDEPYDLQPDTDLIITILSDAETDQEADSWRQLSAMALQAAYGPDEPDYATALIKEPNSDYDGR